MVTELGFSYRAPAVDLRLPISMRKVSYYARLAEKQEIVFTLSLRLQQLFLAYCVSRLIIQQQPTYFRAAEGPQKFYYLALLNNVFINVIFIDEKTRIILFIFLL